MGLENLVLSGRLGADESMESRREKVGAVLKKLVRTSGFFLMVLTALTIASASAESKSIAAGEGFACELTEAAAYCVGADDFGVLGNGDRGSLELSRSDSSAVGLVP